MHAHTIRSMSHGLSGLLFATLIMAQPLAVAAGPSSSGIVGSIVKAPISPDGNVAGAATGFVINLAVDMDPSVPGRVLRAGESIRVQLPDGFTLTDPEIFLCAISFRHRTASRA